MNKTFITKSSILLLLLLSFSTFIPLFAEENKPDIEPEVVETKVEIKEANNEEIIIEKEAIELDLTDHGKVGLNQSIGIALNNNRDLLKQFEDNNVYRLRVFQDATKYFPTLNASYDFKLNTDVKEITIQLPGLPQTMSFNSNERTEGTTTLTATQPITDLYKISLNHRVSKENYNVSLLQTDLQKEDTINNVSKLYFNLLKEYDIIEYYKSNIKQLEEYHRVAQDKYEVGDALARDAFKIQIQVDNAKHDLFVEENNLKVLLTQFKNELGIGLNDKIEVIKDYKEETLQNEPFEELKEIAYDNRPELKQAEKNIHISKLNKKLSLAEYIPQATVYFSFYHIQGSGLYPANNGVLGANVSYDFWQWNKKGFAVKEQSAEVRKSKLDYESTKNSIAIDVETSLNSVKEAADSIRVSKNNVELATESLRITKNRYDVGLAIVLDLLDDQSNLLDAQIQYASSLYDYQTYIIDLKKTLGVLD